MHEKGIETFLAVAMSRTLGKAADLLNVTQSTISYNLSELESEMGMILVDRQKGMKSVRLTPAGESFLPLALKWQDVSREIGNARNPGSAYSLTVGGSENINSTLMPEVFNTLLEHEPPVFLRVMTAPSDQLYQAVENRALDVALCTHEENTRYVQIEPVLRDGFVTARIPYQGELPAAMISQAELNQGLEVYIEWSGGFRLWHDHIWDPSKSCRVTVNSVLLAASVMKRPGSWCMIPESAKDAFRRQLPEAVFQKVMDPPPALVYYKLTHRYPKSSAVPGLTIFEEVLKQRVSEFETEKEKDKKHEFCPVY